MNVDELVEKLVKYDRGLRVKVKTITSPSKESLLDVERDNGTRSPVLLLNDNIVSIEEICGECAAKLDPVIEE